jgi:alanine racemase
MDLTMIDLTQHPEVGLGAEVVLFGEQRGAELPVEEVARGSETLPYEVLCTIGKRVTRLYRRGDGVERLTTLVGERPDWVRGAADYIRRRDARAGVG